MTNTDGLWLGSDSLLSKWGFGDGDEPEEVVDMLDEHGIDYLGLDWHAVLRRLVREHLVPVLEHDVVVVDIETCHNPIRASLVDGQDVEDCWTRNGEKPALTPDGVRVPYEVVLATIAEVVA